LAPHIYFPQFLNDNVPEERTAGMKMGREMLKQCRILIICGDEITEGMTEEILLAQQLCIPSVSLEKFLLYHPRDRPPAPQTSVLERIIRARTHKTQPKTRPQRELEH
jgi:hypothetical protein